MKAARYLITIAWLALASFAFADDFTITDFSINPGETKTVSIELNSIENSYVAFEFYLVLPEDLSIQKDEEGYLMAELNDTRINRHILEVSLMPDGTYHFLCYSNRNTLLKGTSGEIISLTVTAAEKAEPSNKEGKLIAQKLSDPDENKVTFDDFTFHVTVTGANTQNGYCPHGCLLGDVNHDGSLTISDVMSLVSLILGQ
ncbi:MAG: hypothetical protein J5529_13410 [Prevotella sp.]|nr:hypothetical protein [Prevotella sp.]